MQDVFAGFRLVQPVAQQEQIAEYLRQQIRSDALPEGTRLPTTQELAHRWGVTVTVIQAALAPLVREGLLLRKPRIGTVVRERPKRLARVGLYRISNEAREGADHFSRRLAAVTAARLAARGIGSDLFTDLRPEAERVEPPADLLQAVRTGRIDAVVGCETEGRVHRWLPHLPVPTVLYGAPAVPNSVCHDFAQFAEAGVARLAGHGCRSAALVSVFPADDEGARGRGEPSLEAGFRAATARLGLATRPSWIRSPAHGVFLPETAAERFGYDEVRALWSAAERPDGLVVFTDLAARGVIMGLLACIGDGKPTPRLVLHRNAELGLFCPIPADFLDVNLGDLAEVLIGRIEAQRRGEPMAPLQVAFSVG